MSLQVITSVPENKKEEQERQGKQSSIKSASQLFLKFWFVIHCWLNLNLTNTEVVTVNKTFVISWKKPKKTWKSKR